ncbi:MAG: hypothetical protein KGI80_06540, partial [Verrucomicrobiota bacterium]|nr:hypothetical protein [Verrucomicrobiota bacterium]
GGGSIEANTPPLPDDRFLALSRALKSNFSAFWGIRRIVYLSLLLISCAALTLFFVSRKEEKKLLVVGCARSGTLYISTLLKNCGMHIRHERMGRDGMSTCDFAVLPKIGRWNLRPEDYHFDHIFHQIRDPLQVISSTYVTEDIHSWHFIIQHIPQITIQDPHLVKCAKYWYYWNLAAESIAEWSYRLEDLEEKWGEFQQRLGISFPRDALCHVPKNTNSWGTKTRHYFTWADLKEALEPDLFTNICTLAKRYGYATPE